MCRSLTWPAWPWVSCRPGSPLSSQCSRGHCKWWLRTFRSLLWWCPSTGRHCSWCSVENSRKRKPSAAQDCVWSGSKPHLKWKKTIRFIHFKKEWPFRNFFCWKNGLLACILDLEKGIFRIIAPKPTDYINFWAFTSGLIAKNFCQCRCC